MHARVLPKSSSHSVELEKELETLKEENARLRETLQDSESRLDRLQDGVVKLQEEYRSESEELQERVEEMTALIEEDEGEKVELRIDLEKMTRAKKVAAASHCSIYFTLYTKSSVHFAGARELHPNSALGGRIHGVEE